jgi:hypothetical protein
MDGMLTDEGWRVRPSDLPLGCVALPDLTDPATLGCLLALVREAWSDKAMTCARVDVLDTYIAPLPGGYPYGVVGMDRRRIFKRYFGSEAEALVAALEAAP